MEHVLHQNRTVSPAAYLGRVRRELLRRILLFQEIITSIHFEGKPLLGKNLRRAEEMLSYFKIRLAPQFALEEKAVFPFLETHVPRLQSALRLLKADHEEFLVYLKSFESALKKIQGKKPAAERIEGIARIREVGTFMVYFLRNHVRAESLTLAKAIRRDLRDEERRELREEIKKLMKDRPKQRPPKRGRAS